MRARTDAAVPAGRKGMYSLGLGAFLGGRVVLDRAGLEARPELVTEPDPEPDPGRVILEVTAAGLCLPPARSPGPGVGSTSVSVAPPLAR